MSRSIPPRALHAALVGATLGAILGPIAPAHAQSVWDSFPLPKSDWSVFSGFTFSDNITKAPNGPSDTVFTVGATGSLFKDEGRLFARVLASAWYEEYLNNTYKGDLLGSMAANLRYDFVPDRFSWTLDNTYGQGARNTFAPASPGNRVNSNVLSTGPDVTLPFGTTTGLRLAARYGMSTFDDPSIQDENRYSGTVGLFRRFSPTFTGSLNGSYAKTEYQNGGIRLGAGEVATGYDIREAFARMEARRARYAVSVDGGVTEVNQNNRTDSSPLLRLNFYRRLTSSVNLNLGASQEYRSGSDILGEAIRGVRIVNNQVVYIPPGIDPTFVYNVISDVSNRNQPVKYQNLRAAIDVVRPRTTFGVSASSGRERYQFSGQSLDRDVWDFSVNASRRIRPTLTGTIGASYYERKFVNLPSAGGDRNTNVQLQINWQYTSQIAFNGGIRHERRDSDIDQYTYDENVVYIGLTYGGRPKSALFTSPTGGGVVPASATPGQSGAPRP